MRNPHFDIDYVGSFLFESIHVDPAEMVPTDPNLDGLADSPPPISGYRDANVQGIACWNCGHFSPVADWDNDGDVDGICNLFEAKVEGECTCDRFTAHADLLRQSPHTSWTEDLADQLARTGGMGPSVESVDYSDKSSLNEIFLAGSNATEEDGLVWKEILRTGEWQQTPTSQGILDRKIQIVRDGESDPNGGILSLAEIFTNFEERAVPYVTIPLSDDRIDHKNIARLNTGFVRKLKIVDRDGVSVLVAGMDFTEPEVKEKVLRGTIPDVSAGIPFGVTRRKDKKTFRTVLDHVCLTAKPFIDGLTPFGLAAADSDAELPVQAWEADEVTPPESESTETDPSNSNTPEGDDPPPADNPAPVAEPLALSFRQIENAIRSAMTNQIRLSSDYILDDVNQGTSTAVVVHRLTKTKWTVPFRLTNDSEKPVKLAQVDHWTVIESEPQPEAVTASDSDRDALTRARELRELRLAQPTGNTGGIHMSVSAPSLEGVELSDEARNRVNAIIAENETLRRANREAQVGERIAELEAKGLKDRPGALKFYREIMLADDGGAAIILFADNPDESKRERLTALEVLDRFIKSLEADGGVTFSDQSFESGNDAKPPKDASGETKPLEERVAESKEALYGKGKRTGRK